MGLSWWFIVNIERGCDRDRNEKVYREVLPRIFREVLLLVLVLVFVFRKFQLLVLVLVLVFKNFDFSLLLLGLK
jgi:hypothetical protein